MGADVPVWVIVFLGVYFTIALCLFAYGLHAYLMAGLYRRVKDRSPASCPPSPLPRVTVQLPLFNERYVARRLIQAVTRLEYPRELLEIQVLDDSTDDTVLHVAELVAEWQRQGWAIEHVRRPHRRGYKGGALREGLGRARGEFLAVFDADFLPPPGFLRETLPHFADPRVGMVQTRWTHLNEDYSVLTRAQAATLDGHFLIEHTVRNRCGAFINFNGTAGIWRKSCILAAGNWQDDTLTEDLDLSYRAQLAGWRFVFLPGVECPAELPAEVNGLKGQQFRWAKGSVQTALKILPRIRRSSLPWFTRLEAWVHLTSHAVYPLLLLLGLSALPALCILDRYPATAGAFRVATVLAVASFGHPWLYFAAQRVQGRGWLASFLVLPLVLAGNMGIAVNNTRAMVEALLGRSSAFERTPKYALRTRGDRWHGKRYRVAPNAWPIVEIFIAVVALGTVVYALRQGHYLAVPFLLLYVMGCGYMGAMSLWHGLRTHRRESDHDLPGTLAPALAAGE